METPAHPTSKDPSAKQVSSQALGHARTIAARLREAAVQGVEAETAKVLKESDFLSHTIRLAADPVCVYRTAFDALLTIGQASLPLAAGLTMHQYVTAALATAPSADGDFCRKRALLSECFIRERWLAAVCSVDQSRAPDGSIQSTVTATRSGAGRYRVDGTKRFTSLLSHADVLFLTASVEGRGMGLFAAPTAGARGLQIGACLAPGFMTETDTRSLQFSAFEVDENAMLSSGDGDGSEGKHSYSLSWFHALVAAPYLGAATEALKILKRDEAQRAPSGGNDDTARELGKLSLQLEQALLMSRGLHASLGALAAAPETALPAFSRDAQLMKYHGTRIAREVVSAVIERIGIRGTLEYPHLAKIAQGIGYGPLHPRSAAWIERGFGAALLET